jgi:hypothetical protein
VKYRKKNEVGILRGSDDGDRMMEPRPRSSAGPIHHLEMPSDGTIGQSTHSVDEWSALAIRTTTIVVAQMGDINLVKLGAVNTRSNRLVSPVGRRMRMSINHDDETDGGIDSIIRRFIASRLNVGSRSREQMMNPAMRRS